ASLYRVTRIATLPTGRRRPESSGMEENLVREQVPELVALGAEIILIVLRGARHERHPLDDLESVALETHQLPRVVGHHADGGQPEIAQDLGADTVVPKVWREPEPLVGLHRVGSRVLESVGADLVEEADAPSFLVQVNDHPSARLSHQL